MIAGHEVSTKDRETKGRVVIVTGGATGIGLETSQTFARAGDHIVMIGRRKDKLEQAARLLAKNGGRADYICADLTQSEDVSNLLLVCEQRGITGVDILINNAGASIPSEGATMDNVAQQFIRNFEANVLSAVLVTEALKPKLKSPGGRIINVSSIVALRGGAAAYSAAKAAIIGWSYSLANELSAKKITVNTIAPGYIENTEFFGNKMTKDLHEWFISQTPLGRAGQPHDVAAMAFFLASNEASFITGQVIQINGGALTR